MLQYILTPTDKYSIAEQAQMAIEGGCGWIILNLGDLSDEDTRTALVPDVVEMCRQAGIFLTVCDRPELARELGLHGVHISAAFATAHPEMTPAALRDTLGPEAVIGVETADASAVPTLTAADIDYVCTPAAFRADERRAFVDAVSSSGAKMPVVVQGNITADNAAALLAEGFNALAASDFITEADDPVEATREILQKIGQ